MSDCQGRAAPSVAGYIPAPWSRGSRHHAAFKAFWFMQLKPAIRQPPCRHHAAQPPSPAPGFILIVLVHAAPHAHGFRQPSSAPSLRQTSPHGRQTSGDGRDGRSRHPLRHEKKYSPIERLFILEKPLDIHGINLNKIFIFPT